MRRALLALVALPGGCDAAFGLDTVVAPIAGTVDFVSVDNDASFMPTAHARPYSRFELTVVVVDAMGGATPIAYDEDAGTFAVPRVPGQRARIQLRFGTIIFEYQWDAPALTVHEISFARLDAMQATPATTLTGAVTPPLPTLSTTVFATGVWAQVAPSFDAAGFHTAWSGGLPSTAANDQMIFGGYDLSPEGYAVLDEHATLPAIEMTPGANPIGTVTLAPLPLADCVHPVGDVVADAARVDAAYPAFGSARATATIDVFALPAPQLAIALPWLLAHVPDRITDATLHYTQIFPGFMPMVAAVAQRDGALPDGTPTVVQTISYQPIEDATCAAPLALVAHDVAIPTGFVVANQPLDPAGAPIALPSTFELAWQADGSADLFRVEIYDVTGAAAFVPHLLFSTAPHVTLDASDFVAGHRYVFLVRVDVGLPGIAGGDIATRGYPAQQAIALSPAFAVQ